MVDQGAAEVERILRVRPRDYLQILGLPAGSSLPSRQDIRNAARRLWLLVHPDKTHAPRAAEAFRAVRDAEQEMLLKADVAERKKSTPVQAGPRTPAPSSGKGQRPPMYSYESDEDIGSEYEGSDSDDEEEGFWSNYYHQYPDFDFFGGFSWGDFRKQREEFRAGVTTARKEAERRQNQYEKELKHGVPIRKARLTLAKHDSGAVDYRDQINKTKAKHDFMLNDRDIADLKPMKVQNRHDPTWAPEQLFKRSDIINCAIRKHGLDYEMKIRIRRSVNSAKKKKSTPTKDHRLAIIAPSTPSMKGNKQRRRHKKNM